MSAGSASMGSAPEPIRGRSVSHVRFAWSGPIAEGERWVHPLRDVARPLIDSVRDMPYREVGSIHHEPTTPVPFLAKNSLLGSLDEGAVKALLEVAGPAAEPPYLVELRHFGGALSRPPRIPNAIGRRDAEFCLYSGAVVSPGRYASLCSAHETLHARLSRWATGAVCVNFLMGPEVTTEVLRSAYLPVDFDRLAAVKKRYAPFRLSRPAPAGCDSLATWPNRSSLKTLEQRLLALAPADHLALATRLLASVEGPDPINFIEVRRWVP